MPIPYRNIQTDDQTLNRIQDNLGSAIQQASTSSLVMGVVAATQIQNQAPPSGYVFVVDTTSIATASTTVPVTISLPDATKNKGYHFWYKKIDSSAIGLTFLSTFPNSNSVTQTVNGSSSLTVTTALASGHLFSDGNNWWSL